MKTTYLDWAASAPPMPNIVSDAAEKAALHFANPSSLHAPGAAARDAVEGCRLVCADELNADPGTLTFTSGGSESNNIILSSLMAKRSAGSLVISGIEHASVYGPAKLLEGLGRQVTYIRAEKDGRIAPSAFASKINPETIMVSLMLVNNETGAVQPVASLVKKIRETSRSGGRRIHVHCDAVQAFGKFPIDVEALDIDSLSASGHKIGAPRGAGLLYLRRPLETVYRGGGQEADIRPGTENLFAISGLAGAASAWTESRDLWYNQAAHHREALLKGMASIPGARLSDETYLDTPSAYSPFIVSVSFPPIPGEVLVRVMNDRGFAISTGSACSSRSKKNLRVLENMGLDRKYANSAIRVSIGTTTTDSECAAFCESLRESVGALQSQMGGV